MPGKRSTFWHDIMDGERCPVVNWIQREDRIAIVLEELVLILQLVSVCSGDFNSEGETKVQNATVAGLSRAVQKDRGGSRCLKICGPWPCMLPASAMSGPAYQKRNLIPLGRDPVTRRTGRKCGQNFVDDVGIYAEDAGFAPKMSTRHGVVEAVTPPLLPVVNILILQAIACLSIWR